MLRARTSREAATSLGNGAAPSCSSWAKILSPPKGRAWSKFARPVLSLLRTEDVQKQKHSCSARAFLRPYSSLKQTSFTSKSGVLRFCDLQRTKAGICSFKLLLNIFIWHKQVDVNNKKSCSSSVLKGNPFLLLISKSVMTHICLNGITYQWIT